MPSHLAKRQPKIQVLTLLILIMNKGITFITALPNQWQPGIKLATVQLVHILQQTNTKLCQLVFHRVKIIMYAAEKLTELQMHQCTSSRNTCGITKSNISKLLSTKDICIRITSQREFASHFENLPASPCHGIN